jgi:N-acetylmuramidase/Protein of unknown function (DUF1353)
VKTKLSEQDFKDAAVSLKCEVAVIKAVTEVESRGNGFLPDDQPVILFERHIFSRYTKGKYDKDYPDISNPKAGGYQGGAAEHKRLAKAVSLDRNAALMSASWGLFQIMGFNFAVCGFTTLQKFINAMYRSEKDHLLAFIEFIKQNNLAELLRNHRWAEFAKRYNGPDYKKNKYDEKLAKAYKKYAVSPLTLKVTAQSITVRPRYQGQVRTEWLVHDKADREMKLLEDFSFTDSEGYTWKANKGDKIDGASIPQFLWSFVGSPFVGDYRRASVVHDVACQRKEKTSRDAHRMFYEAMLADGFPEASAMDFYTAVRLFGPQWELNTKGQLVASSKKAKSHKKHSFAEIEAAIDIVLGE